MAAPVGMDKPVTVDPAGLGPVTVEKVACPFCSLLCDDLTVAAEGARLRVTSTGCPIATAEFARPVPAAWPLVRGEPARLEEAVARAAALLAASRLPLLAGLGTDVAGMREALALAERLGGVVDHAGSRGVLANVRVLQDGGYVTTTLAEVRNRADLVLFVGTDARAVAPRFVERCLRPEAGLFGPLRRRLVYLGEGLRPAESLPATALPCPPEALPEAIAALRALARGARLRGEAVGGLPLAGLEALAGALREASYPVIVWAARELEGHADLMAGQLAALIKELNVRGRCAGLPLAGGDNVVGCNQVIGWQAGVPLRTSFADRTPRHDPLRWDGKALLQAGGVDGLLWIAGLRDQPLPDPPVPTILLARPDVVPRRPVEVLIPIGAPGLDHAGAVFRTDGVVSLPVRALRATGLPSAAAVLRHIQEALDRRERDAA